MSNRNAPTLARRVLSDLRAYRELVWELSKWAKRRRDTDKGARECREVFERMVAAGRRFHDGVAALTLVVPSEGRHWISGLLPALGIPAGYVKLPTVPVRFDEAAQQLEQELTIMLQEKPSQSARGRPRTKHPRLTDRQRGALHWADAGETERKIAARLNMKQPSVNRLLKRARQNRERFEELTKQATRSVRARALATDKRGQP